MPVMLENGSDAIRTWLDPRRTEWSRELQSLLKPFDGELECYAVSKDVGKVGNNSPTFIVPVASSENKQNIANFFANAKKQDKSYASTKTVKMRDKKEEPSSEKIEQDSKDDRITVNASRHEHNAPVPVPKKVQEDTSPAGLKRGRISPVSGANKSMRTDPNDSPAKLKNILKTPEKAPVKRTTRSAMSNGTAAKKSPSKRTGNGSQKITNFFNQG